MLKKQYSFISRWRIRAPLDAVWNVIYDSENWTSWWDDVRSVKEMEKGDEDGIGSIRVYELSSPTRYNLKFYLLLTEKIEKRLLEGRVSGDLEGEGSWHFKEQDGITEIVCTWQVSTNIKWMNYLSFILSPLFKFNHSLVMKKGAKSLAKKLAAPLLSS